jgi:hypothetical protein
MKKVLTDAEFPEGMPQPVKPTATLKMEPKHLADREAAKTAAAKAAADAIPKPEPKAHNPSAQMYAGPPHSELVARIQANRDARNARVDEKKAEIRARGGLSGQVKTILEDRRRKMAGEPPITPKESVSAEPKQPQAGQPSENDAGAASVPAKRRPSKATSRRVHRKRA